MFLQADITPLTKDTGWMPKVSFIDGIQRIVNSIRGHRGGDICPFLIFGHQFATDIVLSFAQDEGYESCG